jgi:hypothetical protein
VENNDGDDEDIDDDEAAAESEQKRVQKTAACRAGATIKVRLCYDFVGCSRLSILGVLLPDSLRSVTRPNIRIQPNFRKSKRSLSEGFGAHQRSCALSR